MINQTTSQQLSNRLDPRQLFPTLGSLNEVIDYADSKVPVTSKNEMYSLLMIYHNTLLKTLQTVKS